MRLIEAYSTESIVEADFVQQLLRRERIAAYVRGGMTYLNGQLMPGLRSGEEVQVLVRQDDLPSARAVLDRFKSGEYRQTLRQRGNWTCSKCGEELEPQFTDCWNCGTHRPEPDGPANDATAAPPPVLSEIGIDIACRNCGYNLRGLNVNRRCPECGLLIVRTLLDLRSTAPIEMFGDVMQLLAGPIDRAVSTGFPQSAVWFLIDAWTSALAAVPPPLVLSADDLDVRRSIAMELCNALADFALDYFVSVDEALPAFESWKLRTCADLGRALFTLIAQELIEPTDRVGVDDFSETPIEALFPPPAA